MKIFGQFFRPGPRQLDNPRILHKAGQTTPLDIEIHVNKTPDKTGHRTIGLVINSARAPSDTTCHRAPYPIVRIELAEREVRQLLSAVAAVDYDWYKARRPARNPRIKIRNGAIYFR